MISQNAVNAANDALAANHMAKQYNAEGKALCVDICRSSKVTRDSSLALKKNLLDSNVLNCDWKYTDVKNSNDFQTGLSMNIGQGLSDLVGPVGSEDFGLGFFSPKDLHFGTTQAGLLDYCNKHGKGDISGADLARLKKSKTDLTTFITNTRNSVILFWGLDDAPLSKKAKTAQTKAETELEVWQRVTDANALKVRQELEALQIEQPHLPKNLPLSSEPGPSGPNPHQPSNGIILSNVNPNLPDRFINTDISGRSAMIIQDEVALEPLNTSGEIVNAKTMFLERLILANPCIAEGGSFIKIDRQTQKITFTNDDQKKSVASFGKCSQTSIDI